MQCSEDFYSNDEHNAIRLAERAAEETEKKRKERRQQKRRRARNASQGEVVTTLLCGITVAIHIGAGRFLKVGRPCMHAWRWEK